METQLLTTASLANGSAATGANPNAEDLYEILGVAREATADEIRKAFRVSASKHHPDHNGNTPKVNARFAKIKDAYEVLRDPITRTYYDDTGMRKPEQVVIDKMASDLAHRLFNDAMAAATGTDDPNFSIELFDPVFSVRRALDGAIDSFAGMRTKWQSQISRYESMKRRFKKRGGDFESTPVSRTIDDTLKKLRRMLTASLTDIEVHERAREFANEYSCDPEIFQPVFTASTFTIRW